MGDYQGVYEDRGKCRIKWYQGKTRKSLTLDIAYSPAGVKRAYKIREQHLKAFRRGITLEDRGPCPTFGKIAQTRLNTAKLTPETRRTQKSYLNKYWIPVFGETRIDLIQYDELLDAFEDVLQGSVAPKTSKHIFSAGSGVFELAIKSNWRTDNPARVLASEIDLVKKIADPFTKAERDMILDSLEDNQHLFYAIRFYCGLRPSEAIALRWTDYRDSMFHITKGMVRGNEGVTKTKVERKVPVHPYVANLLKSTPRQIRDNHIVTTHHGAGYASGNQLAKSFSTTLKRLNIRYRSPYNVRHTCATMMLEQGMKPAYCAKVLGHSLEMFFNVYADWIDKEESDAQAIIWASIK